MADHLRLPSTDELRSLAAACHLPIADADLGSYGALMEDFAEAYAVVDALPDERPAVAYPRSRGTRPDAADNPYNAWAWRTRVEGAPSGPLLGRTVALKDNIMLAGVPMSNGSRTLEGYVPDFDATVVTRLLDAGATIAGKSTCEHFCISGGSHTSDTGPVRNPYDLERSAAGSSSGSAVLVATGEVDLAIGGDQGGSVRMPSAFCGIVGMKPTWGLIPYTGVMPIEIVIDHLGPMTRTVADNALLLEVIAGPDGRDPRGRPPAAQRYTDSLELGVEGMRIAVLSEGFTQRGAEASVNASVRAGAERLASLGAKIEEVSIPLHRTASSVWVPIAVEGLTQTMMYGDGFGVSRDDTFPLSLMDAHRKWRSQGSLLSDPLTLCLLWGTWARQESGSRFYGKAANVIRIIRAAYDTVLADHDLLLLPTTPMTPTRLPDPDAPPAEVVGRAFEIAPNTAPFNLSHHPAISIPCGLVDGLPVGMMLVGRHGGESDVYAAASAFERSGDWRSFS